MCSRLHQTVHAHIDSCSPEVIQGHTRKFRNHRVRCTFHNNIRISKGHLFFNQQDARTDSVFSLSLRRPSELSRWNQMMEENSAWSGRTTTRFFRADSRSEVLLKSWSREVHILGHRKVVKSLSHYWSWDKYALHRLQEHTNDHQCYFHASEQISFFQDANHCCATVDRSVGSTSHSWMNAQCKCPGSQRFAHQMVRSFLFMLTLSVDAPSTSQSFFVGASFVIVLLRKALHSDRKVAWSTGHDSTQTRATNNEIALGIESSPHHSSRPSDVLWENWCPASVESVSVDQKTDAQGSRSHQEHHFELGLWTGM